MGKVGIFGGSFNPVHIGHIQLAEEFHKQLQLDKLIIIPANIPPHKSSDEIVSGELRLEMCKLAFSHINNCEVSNIELKRDGKSYTYDTLIELSDVYKNDDLYFIMGSDMFFTLQNWYRFNDFKTLATFCTAAREKDEYFKLLQQKNYLETLNVKCKVIEISEIVLSSTELRDKIKSSQKIENEIPENILKFIKENKIYTRYN